MLLLRWSSQAALKLYSMMGQSAHARLLDEACNVRVDAVRAHTLLATATASVAQAPPAAATTAAAAGMSFEQRDAAAAVAEALDLLERASAWRGTAPTAAELPCPIDDDETHARVAAELDELRRNAAKADDALKLGDAEEDSDEDA